MAPLAQTRDPFGLVGKVVDGRYRVDRVVAEGGFGVVYRAHHVTLDRPAALKALKLDEGPGRLPEFREHFNAEARTMARLRHANIADVYDSGIAEIEGREIPWIALEWLEGRTLEQQLAARRGQGGLAPLQVLALLKPALQALAYAHREGIAHRDIKPANLMVTDESAGPHVRVLDFGISKLMSPDEEAGTGRTRTGGMYAFSPGYASPEQISAGRTGPWTDVHAIGLIFTEVLTDRPAIEGTEIALYSQILSEKRPTPSDKGFAVGPWETVLARAMALQPSLRWKDAGALLAALEASVDAAEKAYQEARLSLSTRPTEPAVPARNRVAATLPASAFTAGEPLPALPPARVPPTGGQRPGRRGMRAVVGLLALAGVATATMAVWRLRGSRPGGVAPSAVIAPERAPSVAPPRAPTPAAPPAPASTQAEAQAQPALPPAAPEPSKPAEARKRRSRRAPPPAAAPAPPARPIGDPSDLQIR